MSTELRLTEGDEGEAQRVRIRTDRLELNMPTAREAEWVLDYFRRNRAHLEAWEPARPHGFYTVGFWKDRLEHSRWEYEQGASMRVFMRFRDDPTGAIIGSCNFTHIVRGVFLACNLGYGLDREQEGKGLMFEALSAANAYAFTELGLHRIQASYQPGNDRSARLLKRLGFVAEGYARDYLFINGAWRDHVLTALVRGDS